MEGVGYMVIVCGLCEDDDVWGIWLFGDSLILKPLWWDDHAHFLDDNLCSGEWNMDGYGFLWRFCM